MNDINDMDYKGEEIKLDKIRHIKYTIRGLKILAQKFGSVTKAFDVMQNLDVNFSLETLDNIITLLYAGLIHEDKTLTIDDVENMIDFTSITSIFTIMAKALVGSNPMAKEATKETQGESLLTSIELSIPVESNGKCQKAK